ncbi:MAG: T9SS type A sorting domain-containing protein [Flavobacteriales bacterium]|nr:T9SS type A sorting domain-containing protein [Flavobacteriales bacterium]
MLRLNLFLIVVLLNISQACAQVWNGRNYALNGSFEEITSCPRGQGGIYLAKHYFPSIGTSTDLFARCGAGNVGVPKNDLGDIEAADGDNMAGIMATTEGYRYYDYIIGTLDHENMIPGRAYCITMNVSLAWQSPWALDQLAITFSDSNSWYVSTFPDGTKRYFNPLLLYNYPTTSLGLDADMTNRTGWETIKGTLVYRSGLKYFWIGANHNSPKKLTPMNDVQRVFNPDRTAYYFIDAIQIREIPDEPIYVEIAESGTCNALNWMLRVPGNPSNVWWFRDSQIIGTGRVLELPASAELQGISARATFSSFCDTLDFMVDPGFEGRMRTNLFRYYPNPVRDTLYFNTPQSGPLEVELWDMVGRYVRKMQFVVTEQQTRLAIPVEDLPSGVYFIRSRSSECFWEGRVMVY